jgi:hypothetical protein
MIPVLCKGLERFFFSVSFGEKYRIAGLDHNLSPRVLLVIMQRKLAV